MENSIHLDQALSYLGKSVKATIDRPLHSKHPKHDFLYELNYGFVPGTKSGDGEELDAYVLGVDKPLKTFEGICVAVIHRTNDNDDKLVLIPEEAELPDEAAICKATFFQEQWFESEILTQKELEG